MVDEQRQAECIAKLAAVVDEFGLNEAWGQSPAMVAWLGYRAMTGVPGVPMSDVSG